MADIELVIKIDDEIYKKIKNNEFWLSCGLDLSMAYDLIKNGTPLPKGHGKLIDADALENTWHEEFLKGMSISAGMVNTFNDASTIIEADKAEK